MMSSLYSEDAESLEETSFNKKHAVTADPVPLLCSTVRDDSGCLGGRADLERFTILRQLGVGGMGTVFAAYDEQLDRKVALKILHNPDNQDQSHRDRAMREAKALARVRHPRVVSIYDVGTTNGRLYLAMEFVDGVTLREWLAAAPRSWREILRMFIQAGEGLHAAHEAGVIHRDFKPDNVLVGNDGFPLVLDFGIARLGRPESAESERAIGQPPSDPRFTFQGMRSGTPGYMSPEQYGNAPASSATDQYSFCVALYEALCGYLPFSATTPQEYESTLRGPIRPPPPNLEFPTDILRILSRGLSLDAASRYPSMKELLQALSSEHGQTSSAAAAARRRLSIALVSISIVAILLVQYLSHTRGRILLEAVYVSTWLVSVTLLSGYLNRRELRANVFHRQVYLQLLVTFSQILLYRVTVLALPFIPFRQILIAEMVIWIGAIVTLATTVLRRLFFAVLVPMVGIGVGLAFDAPPRGPSLMLYFLCSFSILWAWHREAKQPRPSST